MILKQYYLGCLSHASYLIGDETTGAAAVVDPQRDIDQYLEDAKKQNLDIQYVLLTHVHADFVAGHIELRDRVGAEICMSANAKAEYEFRGMSEGDFLGLGTIRLEFLETPGHTYESMCITVLDLEHSTHKPRVVLTGDTLFIGDVGRPDLQGAIGWSSDELAGMLYDSLHNKLLGLPDETLVYPAHGAGSMCGKNLSKDTVSDIGTQKKYNYALQEMTREEFVKLITAEQPEAPAYFSYDAQMNSRERVSLEESLQKNLKPLTLEKVISLRASGAQLLDVREPVDYAGAHFLGSTNIPLDGRYASWAGTLLGQERPIVIIAAPDKEREAAMRLGRIGFDHVAGYLDGGMAALDAHPELIARTDRITVQSLAEQLTSEAPPQIIDIRMEKEWKTGHIEGSVNFPLGRLSQFANEIPSGRFSVLICETGYRASIAASILEQHDRDDVLPLVGGFEAWKKANLEIRKVS